MGSQRWLGSTARHGLPSLQASASQVKPVEPSNPMSKTAITRFPAQASGIRPRIWNQVVLHGGPHRAPTLNAWESARIASAHVIGARTTPKEVSSNVDVSSQADTY